MTPSLIGDSVGLGKLKTDIAANANTVLINGNATAISAAPVSPDNAAAVAAWYNQTTSYLVWNTATSVKAVRAATDLGKYTPSDAVPASPSTDMTYQNRALLCQLKQSNAQFLLQGADTLDATSSALRATFSDCMTAIPSGASGANQNAGWGTPAAPGAVRLAMQRGATNAEKLFSAAGSGGGPAGNVSGDARGSTTNPDALANVGPLTAAEVLAAWAS